MQHSSAVRYSEENKLPVLIGWALLGELVDRSQKYSGNRSKRPKYLAGTECFGACVEESQKCLVRRVLLSMLVSFRASDVTDDIQSLAGSGSGLSSIYDLLTCCKSSFSDPFLVKTMEQQLSFSNIDTIIY